ncbi:uncharacterized protein LOC108482219 isoform X1 [Gossypium arboreum]|uniref:uncharacterized protein LOC108482219 isoform X1 n=1 Tax=Gossypium arboreum TaxID=29729 RepID=UPI0022F15336|nr:uncharacterized protein LOC108482219 isoform X1 [Gossypium arboreum]
MADDKPTLEPLLEWFEALIEGTIGQELETRALQGLIITKAEKGFIRTEFTIPSLAADVDGNWHGGAIATLMDIVGAIAIYSVLDHPAKSVDFSISYYSTAKIEKEVEINAKVLGNKGKLIQVMIEVRRKGMTSRSLPSASFEKQLRVSDFTFLTSMILIKLNRLFSHLMGLTNNGRKCRSKYALDIRKI